MLVCRSWHWVPWSTEKYRINSFFCPANKKKGIESSTDYITLVRLDISTPQKQILWLRRLEKSLGALKKLIFLVRKVFIDEKLHKVTTSMQQVLKV